VPSLTKLLTNPTLAVTGNLRWTRSGVVYAEWLLAPRPGGYESLADKRAVAAQHRHLFTDLGRTILTSVVAPIDITAIAARIIQPGHHYHPDYLAEASAQLDEIEQRQPAERIHWLSVPLCAPARTGHIDDDFEPTPEDLTHFQALAAAAERKIPGVFTPRPATPTQMHWMFHHAHVRGAAPTPFPHATASTRVRRARGFRDDGRIDEALATDGRPRRAMTKALKVTLTDTDTPPSYQAFLVVDDFPTALPWPGVADQLFPLLNHFDALGIDYTLRTRTRPRPESLSANARALRQLSEQLDERHEEVSFAQNFLMGRGRLLTQYNHHLEANPAETEIVFCPILALSAAEPDHLEDLVRDVVRTFHDNGVVLTAPYGAQAELWAAAQPGYPGTRASRDYSHIMPTDSFGRFSPITAIRIGDHCGPVIGRNRSSGFGEPVLSDLLGITEKDKSASFMIVGELGGGKSVLLKIYLGCVVDLGGRVWLVDRTSRGEYEAPARSIATDAVVLDVANPTHTMDPLRVFTGPDAAEQALSVLMPLFDIHAGSPESTLLSDLLDPNYRARYHIAALPDLAAHLARLITDPTRTTAIPAGATAESLTALAGQLRFWAQRTFARVLFAPELPPLPMATPMVVLRTHRLQLPDEHEDPRDQPVKLFGQTIYALFALLAQQALFTSPEFGLLMLDESSFLLRSTVGQAVVNGFVLDGRKHNAAVGLASQSPTHFGDCTRLIPTRFAFRQTDAGLARDSARLLRAAPHDETGTADADIDEELAIKLMTDTSPPTEENGTAAPHRRGECLMRDLAGRIAEVKIDLPARPDRAAAVLTTPTGRRDLP
jgi:hypothetical protein